jgi:outer membrane protein TolC
MQQPTVAVIQNTFFSILLLSVSGCASFSNDGGFNAVQKTTQQHLKQTAVWANTDDLRAKNSAQVNALLKEPLSQEDAVQIALLNNANLQANFYQLQIDEADMVEAGSLPNPSFSMLYAKNNGEYKIEQILTMNVLALFTAPKASAIEKHRFEVTQNKVALSILQLARQTRNAYIRALAAKQQVEYLEQVLQSAQASGELAKRMQKAGNWSQQTADREQSFVATTAIDLAQAQHDCLVAEENLTQLLGLSDPSKFKLPPRLPNLPSSEDSLRVVNQEDFSQRLDLQQTRLNTEALAKQLGLSKATRFMNVLELGPARVLEGRRSDPSKKGVEIKFELPIFDWGTAKVKRAEGRYMQAINEAKQQAIVAASEVRSQYDLYLTRYAIAQRYRDEVVPLRKRMLDESLLRYNGMLTSPFELMATAREQVLAVNEYMTALRDFWLADSDLDMALVGSPIDTKGY